MRINSLQHAQWALSLMLLVFATTGSHAQQAPGRFLSLNPPTGLPVIPIMEGWYANEDGSVSISFGYLNRNTEQTLDIPVGNNNFIEPAEFNGSQPTHFQTGRHTGVFTVTLPADRRDDEIWWHIKAGENPVMKVPGRADSTAYELDHRPRPQGSVEPLGWFEEGGATGFGPTGLMSASALQVAVGAELTLTVHARDPSERDPTDPRYGKPVPIRLLWSKYTGPGEVTFTRHPSSPNLEEVLDTRGRPMRADSAEQVTLVEGFGTANVIGTFSEPGDYIIRTRIDNWAASDSTAGDQCCWTNLYQKVTVTP
ncbi:MAG: hypothetical protein RQ757_00330 [Pseudomonadales bacterium]|nr:hypothetical protein [Pseudomonadales bacterium]